MELEHRRPFTRSSDKSMCILKLMLPPDLKRGTKAKRDPIHSQLPELRPVRAAADSFRGILTRTSLNLFALRAALQYILAAANEIAWI
jgi:hypothetical protein